MRARTPSRSLLAVLAAAVVVVAAAVVVTSALGNGSEAEAGSAFRRAVVARGFDSPVHVVSTKSEPQRLYVVEQRGTIRVIQAGRLRPGLFLDIRTRVRSGGEQGLLGLAFDPAYATNRFVYVNFTDTAGNTRVVRYRSSGARVLPRTARLLLRVAQPYSNHNGGNLVFGPDGFLYVGLGDGGSGGDPHENAQNMRTLLGKMLRLNVRRPGSAPVIVGLGLRNPWRYSFDRQTGDLYIGDVGQNAVEEVDFTPRGASGLQNYGWNLYEGSRRFTGGDAGAGQLVFPVFEYGREEGNCTVVGGYVYRGRARPAERGRYLFGDYCSGIVWSFRVVSGEARGVRRERFRIPGGLTTFGEDVTGEIYAASQNGVVYRLT